MTEPRLDASFVVIEPLRETMDMSFESFSGDEVVVTWSVGPESHQPFGILHGGVHAMVVEGLCSLAAQHWLGDEGKVVGVTNTTDFYRAVSQGRLTSTTRPIHRGRSQQVWAVETSDEDGRLVARGQVRLQNLRGR